MSDICPWRHAYLFDNVFRRMLHPPERVLGAYVRTGMTVLDIGCGMGHFSIGMARMVGERGRVIAADVQPDMLRVTMERARRAGVADRIEPMQCEAGNIGVMGPVDFALAFWMVHEVSDQRALFQQLFDVLTPGGLLYIEEPPFHVSRSALADEVGLAESVGFEHESALGNISLLRRSAIMRRPNA